MKPLEGLAALVTGSSSGIGAAIAVHFARAGARVAVSFRQNEAGATETARLVAEAGSEAIVAQADVGMAAEVDRMFGEIDAHFGRLDILVNNAGLTLKTPLLRTTDEQFDGLVSTNLKGAFLCGNRAAERMIGAGGAILNISSVHAARTTYTFGAYSATKGGLEALTRAQAVEFGLHGIRVNALRVGAVSVDRDPILPGIEEHEAYVRRLPIGRAGQVDDIAQLAVFLCSPQASFVTGAVIDIDGGAGAISNTPVDTEQIDRGEFLPESRSQPEGE
jgi:NAD(P)-dependent dehydrogenase (short-subunit alcohol dehydrogenase family)